MTTEKLAARLGLQPHSLRIALCRHGSYFGLKPFKLPNGRLDWPEDSYEQLTQKAPTDRGRVAA